MVSNCTEKNSVIKWCFSLHNSLTVELPSKMDLCNFATFYFFSNGTHSKTFEWISSTRKLQIRLLNTRKSKYYLCQPTYSTVVAWDEEVGEYNSPLFPVRGSTIGVGTQRQVLHELLKHLKVEVIHKHCQVLEQKTNQYCTYLGCSLFVYSIKE